MMNRGVTSAKSTTRQPTAVPPSAGAYPRSPSSAARGIPALAEREDDEPANRDHGEREPLDRVAEVRTLGELGQGRGLGEPVRLRGGLPLEQEVARRDGVGELRLDRPRSTLDSVVSAGACRCRPPREDRPPTGTARLRRPRLRSGERPPAPRAHRCREGTHPRSTRMARPSDSMSGVSRWLPACESCVRPYRTNPCSVSYVPVAVARRYRTASGSTPSVSTASSGAGAKARPARTAALNCCFWCSRAICQMPKATHVTATSTATASSLARRFDHTIPAMGYLYQRPPAGGRRSSVRRPIHRRPLAPVPRPFCRCFP